jgi:hypothetical protein
MLCAECETAAATPVCFPQRCQEGQRHVWAGCGNPRIHHMMLTFVQLSSCHWVGLASVEMNSVVSGKGVRPRRAAHTIALGGFSG